MKCDFKIMAIPSRMTNVHKLMNTLGLSYSDVFIDVAMSHNPLHSSLQLLEKPFGEGVTHRCILQDDVSLSPGFRDYVDQFIKTRQNSIFSLYVSIKETVKKGIILRTGGRIYGPAIIIPRKYIDDIIATAAKVRTSYIHDDGFYSWYAKEHGIEVLTAIPTIVDVNDSKSTLRHSIPKYHNSNTSPYWRYEYISDRQLNLKNIDKTFKVIQK